MISPRVVSLTVFAMLAFASNSLLCRIALRDTAIDAASFTSIRLAAGALMLAAIMLARKSPAMADGSWPMAAMLFGYAAFFSFAYRELTAATGALLLFGAVQSSMLGYGLVKGERLRPLQVAGLLVAVGGRRSAARPCRAPIPAPPACWPPALRGRSIPCSAVALAIRSGRPPAIACAGCPSPQC
jgi:drug/metabolite transporter (DMT)-like permease